MAEIYVVSKDSKGHWAPFSTRETRRIEKDGKRFVVAGSASVAYPEEDVFINPDSARDEAIKRNKIVPE